MTINNDKLLMILYNTNSKIDKNAFERQNDTVNLHERSVSESQHI